MTPRPLAMVAGLLRSLRRPARQRVWALGLACAMVFAALVHVSHEHEGGTPSAAKFCAACVVFDRNGGAPPPHLPSVIAPAALTDATHDRTLAVHAVAACVRTPCCPRAPPQLHA